MKWVIMSLVLAELLIAGSVVFRLIGSNTAVLLLAGNSVALIWAATRWRRKPSCCR